MSTQPSAVQGNAVICLPANTDRSLSSLLRKPRENLQSVMRQLWLRTQVLQATDSLADFGQIGQVDRLRVCSDEAGCPDLDHLCMRPSKYRRLPIDEVASWSTSCDGQFSVPLYEGHEDSQAGCAMTRRCSKPDPISNWCVGSHDQQPCRIRCTRHGLLWLACVRLHFRSNSGSEYLRAEFAAF